MKIQTIIGDIDTDFLKRIGTGGAHKVYEIDEDKVLKVSKGNHKKNAGAILEELQGIPFVPKIYDYSSDGSWHIMQQIHGFTPYHARRGFIEMKPMSFDFERFLKDSRLFFSSCMKRGWEPADINASNVMIDWSGAFWVIDFDCFRGGDLPLSAEKETELSVLEQYYMDTPAMMAMIKRSRKQRFSPLKENDNRLVPLIEVGKEIKEILETMAYGD